MCSRCGILSAWHSPGSRNMDCKSARQQRQRENNFTAAAAVAAAKGVSDFEKKEGEKKTPPERRDGFHSPKHTRKLTDLYPRPKARYLSSLRTSAPAAAGLLCRPVRALVVQERRAQTGPGCPRHRNRRRRFVHGRQHRGCRPPSRASRGGGGGGALGRRRVARAAVWRGGGGSMAGACRPWGLQEEPSQLEKAKWTSKVRARANRCSDGVLAANERWRWRQE